MKTCAKCNIEKPKTDFSRCSAAKDGHQPRCKSCVSLEWKSRYSSNKDLYKSKATAWKTLNKERSTASNHAWYIANLDRHSASLYEFYLRNPDAKSEYERNRRARKLSAGGTHSSADIKAIFTHQRGLCANCNTKLFKSGKQKYHVDHVMPLSKGGYNWPDNLQCLCPTCNLRKSAKDPLDWAKENGKLL